MVQTNNQKEKVLIGLKKARTSLDKILIMLESDDNSSEKKCFDIIQQNLAIIGLLKSANTSMLESHLDIYINDTSKSLKQKKDLKKMKEEIIKIVQMAQKK